MFLSSNFREQMRDQHDMASEDGVCQGGRGNKEVRALRFGFEIV